MNDVAGTVAPGYEAVREAFVEGQAADPGGAQLVVYRRGKIVVDLWTGEDLVNRRAYAGDTLTVLMSCTKAAVALCVHLLAERRLLDLDAPVARYWPEFAANGKQDVCLHHLLSHSAGLMGFDPESGIEAADLVDWDRCTAALAGMRPLWAPGTAYLYHFVTYGHLLGEVIHRVGGTSVGTFFNDEFAKPLGLDFWIGLPEAEERRVAPHFRSNVAMQEKTLRNLLAAAGFDLEDRLVRTAIFAMTTTESLIEMMTTRAGRAAEIPAGNGVGTARALAGLYAGCIGEVNGFRRLTSQTIDKARTPLTDQLTGPAPFDRLAGASPQRFALGFELPRDICPMLGDGSFGHPGAGGRLGFAHPELGVAVGYVCNNLLWDGTTPDPRWLPWGSALREICGVTPP